MIVKHASCSCVGSEHRLFCTLFHKSHRREPHLDGLIYYVAPNLWCEMWSTHRYHSDISIHRVHFPRVVSELSYKLIDDKCHIQHLFLPYELSYGAQVPFYALIDNHKCHIYDTQLDFCFDLDVWQQYDISSLRLI